MKNKYKIFMFAFSLLSGNLFAQTAQPGPQIRIQKNENGNETIIIRKLDKDDMAELEKTIDAEDILKTLGMPGENEEIEVIIRKRTIDTESSAQAPDDEKDIATLEEEMEENAMDEQTGNAFLGVYYNPETTNEGTIVKSVISNSPAQKAGIEPGDFILKVENESLVEGVDLRDIIAAYDPGDKVKIEVLRNGEKKKLHAELSEKPIEQERKIIIREPRIKLGVILNQTSEEAGNMIVEEVLPGSLAEKMGIQKADQLVTLNKMHIDSRSDITMALLDAFDGQEFKGEWMRDGKIMSGSAKVGMLQEISLPPIPELEQFEKMIKDKIECKMAVMEDACLSKDAIVYRFRKIPALESDKSVTPGTSNQEPRLDVSPNPSNGQMKVDFFIPGAKEITLSVTDLNGKEIMNRVFEGKSIGQSVNLNIDNESQGIYSVSLSWEGGKMMKKVVIEK